MWFQEVSHKGHCGFLFALSLGPLIQEEDNFLVMSAAFWRGNEVSSQHHVGEPSWMADPPSCLAKLPGQAFRWLEPQDYVNISFLLQILPIDFSTHQWILFAKIILGYFSNGNSPCSSLKSTTSPRSFNSSQWGMVFRNQALSAICAHYYRGATASRIF